MAVRSSLLAKGFLQLIKYLMQLLKNLSLCMIVSLQTNAVMQRERLSKTSLKSLSYQRLIIIFQE